MGQNFEKTRNINIIKDSLFSFSDEKLEYLFELYIIKTKDIKSNNYLGLIVSVDNVKCVQFIIKKGIIDINNKIYMEIKVGGY